jgi:sugar phosphate isomerase/epimerase
MKNIFWLTAILVMVSISCSQKQSEQTSAESESVTVTQPLFTGEIGIAPYTFRRSFPNGVAETLDTIQNMGFTEIEGGGSQMDPHEYKKLCDERGLSIPSMGAGYEQLTTDLQQVIDRAKVYGSKYIMCAWIPHETGNFSKEDMDKAIEDFNRVGKELHENGLTLSYHTHGYEFVDYEDGTLFDYMLENTDPEYVTYQMDIFWVHFGGGDPVALLRKYPERFKMLHVKDMKKGIPKDHTGLTDPEHDVTLGTGQIDVEGVLRAARDIGIEHYFIEDESSRIIEQIPLSIQYMRSLTL